MEDPYARLSDGELAARFERADEEALAALCRRHYSSLFRFAYRLTQNVSEAEECTQEAFTRFLRGWARWQERDRGAGPWLSTILRNAVVDHWQKAARVKQIADPYFLAATSHGGGVGGPESEALHRELLGAVEQSLAGVEAPCRELIGLLFRDRLTQRDAAEKLGLSHEAVKKRYQRCLKRIQTDLSARGVS